MATYIMLSNLTDEGRKTLKERPERLQEVHKIRPKGYREITPGPVWAHIQPPLTFEPGTPVPDATRQIYDRLNGPHQRVLEEGPEAGRWDYSGRG